MQQESHAAGESDLQRPKVPWRVFVSCGQREEPERKAGESVCKLLENLGHKPFFAQRVHQASALATHIFQQLQQADAYIGIMHRRGQVLYEGEESERQRFRGSAWIHQELAIVAYLSEVLGRSIAAMLFMEIGIEREGAMDALILNPIAFKTNTDLIQHIDQWAKETLRDRPGFDYLRAKLTQRTSGFGPADWKFLRLCLAMGEPVDWDQIKMEFKFEYGNDKDFQAAGRTELAAFGELHARLRRAGVVNDPKRDEAAPSRQSFNIVPMWRPLVTIRLRDLGFL